MNHAHRSTPRFDRHTRPAGARRLGLLIAAGAAAALLSACGPQQPDAAAQAPTSTAQTTTPAGTAPAPVTATTAPAPKAAAVHSNRAPVKQAQASVESQPAAPVAVAPKGLAGQISQIEAVRSDPQPTNGAGAVIGGLLGGVLGNQVGGGDGKKIATVVGAVGGAVAGNNVQRNQNREVVGYRFHLSLDNGQTRTLVLPSRDGFQDGDRVRLVDGQLQPA